MPAFDVTILIWVEVWRVDHWDYNSSATRNVALELVPEYAGSITRKELDYDAVRVPFPVQ